MNIPGRLLVVFLGTFHGTNLNENWLRANLWLAAHNIVAFSSQNLKVHVVRCNERFLVYLIGPEATRTISQF